MGKETSAKTKAELKEEVLEEIREEEELKRKVKKEIEEQELKDELDRYEDKRKRRKVGRVITNIILTILFLFILFETVMGILDMQRINDDKEPLWYINSKTEVTEKKETTTYDLGLYKIVRTDDQKATKITLKPFFLK